MATPQISLAQFNRIATGDYNAGLVDFKTDDKGNVLNELTKVNNHVHKRGENNVVLSTERILEIKEAFINALKNGGVNTDTINKIRAELGIPAELSANASVEEKHKLMQARFRPLTRHEVRTILDEYARNGRGFTMDASRQVSLFDAEEVTKTNHMSKSNAKTRDEVNKALVDACKGRFTVELSDAMSVLSTNISLAKASEIIATRYKGVNAVNDTKAAVTALKNQFLQVFQQAISMLDDNRNESGEFTLFGHKAKLTKDSKGVLTAVIGEGALETKVVLGKKAASFINSLMGRGIVDLETLGADNIKLMLDKIFSHDVDGFLTGEDRTSLTRSFASMILMKKANTPEQRQVEYNELMTGNYNTGTLVEVANKALDGNGIAKEDIDRLHAELATNNAGLDDEMKEMLARVAGMPIEKLAGEKGNYEFVVGEPMGRPIVAELDEVVDPTIPPAPPMPMQAYHKLLAPPQVVKDFIADLVFSDETMVSDVVVNLPGETMRNILTDEKKMLAFAHIIVDRSIIDRAVAPELAEAVKEGFTKMANVLDTAWQTSHNGEKLDAAMKKPDFIVSFSQFLRDKDQLPGKSLAKFDTIIQNMANQGCESIQAFINKVFKINTNAARNEQGGFTFEPYKNLTPEQIKAQLDAKGLNQILDDAAADSSSPGQVALFKQVLSDYFVNMSKSADKRAALASALRYSDTFELGGKKGDDLKSAKNKATAKFTGAILKGTSPLMQKMMQGLPRSVLGEFAEALDDMKSRLAPIPRKIVQAHLMKIIDDSNGKIKSIGLKKSLGAASVGEAFLCEISHVLSNGKVKNEEVVVKIMRHDAEEKVKREADVFTAAAEKIGQGMLKTWQGQLAQYMTEFDFQNEARNVDEGVALYDVEPKQHHKYRAIAPNVRSMKVSKLVAPTKNVMVCTVAEGKTTDSFFGEMRANIQTSLDPVFERDSVTGRIKWDPQTKKPIFKNNAGSESLHNARLFCDFEYTRILNTQKKLQQAASLWFTEALLGSGKFHGDAHAGNLMITEHGGAVTFIDFGNLYQLKKHYELDENNQQIMERVQKTNKNGEVVEVERPKVKLDERVELLRLILGATLRDKNLFLQGFEKLLSTEGKALFTANRAKAEAILDAVLAKGSFSFDVCYRLQGALSELQKLGLEMPPQINCFVQSMTRFQNVMAEMNTILNQTRAVIDSLKEGPGEDKLLPRDPLDLLNEMLYFSKTQEGNQIEQIENPEYRPHPRSPEEKDKTLPVPAFIKKMYFYGNFSNTNPLHNQNSEYHESIKQSIRNAPDKVAEARRIAGLFTRHVDPNLGKILIDTVNGYVTEFERSWNSAQSEIGKEAALKTFAGSIAMVFRQQMNGQASSYLMLFRHKYELPTTFAKVVMGALFNGADAVNKMFDRNFSFLEKLNIGLDAKKIATSELNVKNTTILKAAMPFYKGPSVDEIVMDAIIDDTKNMGGDNSYQIDIGV